MKKKIALSVLFVLATTFGSVVMAQVTSYTAGQTHRFNFTTAGYTGNVDITGGPFAQFTTSFSSFYFGKPIKVTNIDSWQSNLTFTSKDVARMTITTTGNVGIGTTSPQYKLDVNGGIRTTQRIVAPGIHLMDSENFTYKNLGINNYGLGWHWDPWVADGPSMWVSGWGGMKFFTYSQVRMAININGNVGIGTETPGTKLDVAGTIRAHELKVCLNQGCDFVFEEDYNLMSIKDLSTFIKTNKHLPQVAPAAVMESEGINVSEMNALLLQKIEELTLYVIQQEERINILESNNK